MNGTQIIQLIKDFKLDDLEFGVTVDEGGTISEFVVNGSSMKIDFDNGKVFLSVEEEAI